MTRLSHWALCGAAAASVMTFAPAAQAFTFAYSPITDLEFNQLILDGEFEELFVTESRFGNGQTNGDRELGINQPILPNGSGGLVGGLPFAGAQGQRAWTSGQVVSFELAYNALTGDIRYTVGGQLLTAQAIGDTPNGIFLRTRAGGRDGTLDSAITLQNLFLDDGGGFQALANLGSAAAGAGSDVDYMVISGIDGSFTLKGEQIFAWNGATPTGSRLATQIKVGGGSYTAEEEPEAVPEPVAILGTLAAVGVGLASKRRSLA